MIQCLATLFTLHFLLLQMVRKSEICLLISCECDQAPAICSGKVNKTDISFGLWKIRSGTGKTSTEMQPKIHILARQDTYRIQHYQAFSSSPPHQGCVRSWGSSEGNGQSQQLGGIGFVTNSIRTANKWQTFCGSSWEWLGRRCPSQLNGSKQ